MTSLYVVHFKSALNSGEGQRLSLRAMTVLTGLLGLVNGWMNGVGVSWSFSLVGAYAGLVA
jgi:hypothetical protein